MPRCGQSDVAEFAEPRDKDWQEHEQDEDVFPKDDHFAHRKDLLSGIRQALSVPQRAAPRPTSQGPYFERGAP